MVQGAGGAEIKAVADRQGKYSEESESGNLEFEQLVAKSAHGFSIVEATSSQLTLYFFALEQIESGLQGAAASDNSGFSSWYARCLVTKSGVSCDRK